MNGDVTGRAVDLCLCAVMVAGWVAVAYLIREPWPWFGLTASVMSLVLVVERQRNW